MSVVLVPGLGLGPESYEPVRACLDQPAEVVRLPGYGRTSRRHEDLSPPALGEALIREVQALGITSAVLVGHSASCQIVVEAALARPELVAGLVLIGPIGDPTASAFWRLAERWIRSAVHEPLQLIPTLRRQYAGTGPIAMTRGLRAAQRHDLSRTLEDLKIPVVVLRGKHDRIAPASWTDQVARLSGGTAQTLPTGSHLPVLTCGPEIAHAIQTLTTPD
ncbi:alpha/beta hydrolase [Kribbella sp. NBC_01245]|uniref:alpha/beta fold hydrolase n=1 Tax=Kribbella sp. NBC_01245 TaxID=2903578 RepID=UPI002E2973C0|nr:alpha/beta hydrolase [Kribbella sp. NBC_01245]